MKKIIIVLLVVASGFAYWFFVLSADKLDSLYDTGVEVEEGEAQGASDVEALLLGNKDEDGKNVSPYPGVISDKLWNNPKIRMVLVPPDMDPHLLIESKKEQLDDIVEAANVIVDILGGCLTDKSCETKPLNKDSFHDPENTPIHFALKRTLMTLKLAVDEDLRFKSLLSEDQLFTALEVNNSDIQLLALELLLEAEEGDMYFAKLLEKAPTLNEKAVGLAFEILQKKSKESDKNREIYISTLFDFFSTSDAYQATLVLKSFSKLYFSDVEFEKFVKLLCRFKSGDLSSWRTISYHLKNARERGYNADVETICK